ncbi:MAG: hypothetical protein HYY31_02595 [Chloroflexi bacterium]|nr:hypothetical protein [Chloroflexota bacterium]
MKLRTHGTTRRSVLVGGAAAALALATRLSPKPAQAQQSAPSIVAAPVTKVPGTPSDPLWEKAEPVRIALNPQDIVVPRLKEAGAKAINVRALYDADRLTLLLEWLDAHKDTDLGTVLQYRDAVAMQFPEDLSPPTPSFTMGQKGKGVVIYHWKSDWQFGQLYDVGEAYPNMYGDWYQFSGVPIGAIPEATDYLTSGRKEYLTAAAVGNALADPLVQQKLGPVQKMRAEGFGTIEPHPTQDAQGRGLWRDGSWQIFISVPRKQAAFTFEEGTTVPIGFAVWDGSRNERNGQKAFSFWNNLSLGAPVREKAPGGGILVPLLSGLGGVLVAALVVLVGLRVWRARQAGDRTK